jgi:hypothetical protein
MNYMAYLENDWAMDAIEYEAFLDEVSDADIDE